jgi:hypothetical protein
VNQELEQDGALRKIELTKVRYKVIQKKSSPQVKFLIQVKDPFDLCKEIKERVKR